MNLSTLFNKGWRIVVVTAALLVGGLTQAAGLLTPTDGSLPALNIKDHHVSVVVEDGYAITTVEQVFHNPHSRDLEAIYSFPVPKHGAVSEFTMWIDGKPVIGEVLEKKEARRVYEEEKAAGRDAGITEKDSYKTFDISVSPVRAGQDTRIRLVYMQTTSVDTGIGRYVYPLEEGGVDEQKLAFWTANDKVSNSFSFDMKMRSAYPIDALRLPNQPQAVIQQINRDEWQVNLGNSNSVAEEGTQTSKSLQPAFVLEKDLIVYWRHQDGIPGSVDLVTYKPDNAKRGTFMLTLTPGDDLQPITEGSDWIFVLDISGSMSGKYATLADGVQRALGKMRPNDRFRIVLFNNSARELTNGYVNATHENVQRYSQEVSAVQPGNGTNLYSGLRLGLDSLEADRTSAIVLVTDGVANVGETKQRMFIKMLKKVDARLFTFIMGNSANRPMLEAMTKASNGFAVSISNSDDIVGQILAATSKVTHQALHGVKVKIKGIKTTDVTPKEIGSLYHGEQLILMGHYWDDGLAQVEVSGKVSGQPKSYQTNFTFPDKSDQHPELERLWAYASIEQMQTEMEDFGEKVDLKQAATDLALEYSLVSDYTSMVVMRDEQFAARNIERRNQQRNAVEKSSQNQRAATPVTSRRVDSHQPMYSAPRAGHRGGGAVDFWSLLMLLPLLPVLFGKRNEEKGTV
ncbi:MAG: VIT and VWA domain-containing protein [Gammaproteobacteria bacterium]|nr:VIT and VWA domain-containing protein [Gammaproteobacteria bacterium]